jgi:hypothetical protein
MTILLHGQVLLTEALAGTAELSSRPERSVVEGPAVSLAVLTPSLGPEVRFFRLRALQAAGNLVLLKGTGFSPYVSD